MSTQTSGVNDFVTIGEVAETTTQLFNLALQSEFRAESALQYVEQIILQQARELLETVRAGFMLSVRTEHAADGSQLRYLLRRVLVDWEELGWHLGLAVDPKATVDLDTRSVITLDRQLITYTMAATALGYLPRLPTLFITFPDSIHPTPTYADIPVPDSAAATLVRIEEMETVVARLAISDPQQLLERSYGAVRRTYGFFETCAWLVRRHAPRFKANCSPQLVSAF